MSKVLIANRGEIACRIIRTCRKLGYGTVAVYSDADVNSLHRQLADEAVLIGPSQPAESYLNIERILSAAEQTGVDAVHPGYGFLAESADFAKACFRRKIHFVGPSAETLEQLGDKGQAREVAARAGIPVLPGTSAFPMGQLDKLPESAQELGFPVMVKAVAGGGGIGMSRVEHPGALVEAARTTQRLALVAFGDGSIYLERALAQPRHVEVQIFGFGDGTGLHLYERECSIQRRFQKLIEEAPSPGLSDSTREQLYDAALRLVRATHYRNAGTVEFLVDERQDFYFLEVNARIQVEHPVTELITGSDLVAWQIRLALGDVNGLPNAQGRLLRSGAAIECRIYAEDPRRNFMPSPGTLGRFRFPQNGSVRIDTGLREGDIISSFYDPLLCKVIAHGTTREEARARMLDALERIDVDGISSNLPLHRSILQDDGFIRGQTHTRYLQEHSHLLLAQEGRVNGL